VITLAVRWNLRMHAEISAVMSTAGGIKVKGPGQCDLSEVSAATLAEHVQVLAHLRADSRTPRI
jgi:hypothetical protein